MTVQPDAHARHRVLVLGEVLWDLFPDAARLGGAALNVAAHLTRLQQEPRLVSAVGDDRLGHDARDAMTRLGLDMTFVQPTSRHATGRAHVHVGPGEHTSFTIERPAAYDAVDLTADQLQELARWNPGWLYYGTLLPSLEPAKQCLSKLLDALPWASRFYDLNLRPGFASPPLVDELLHAAHVVKLNEDELRFVHEQLDLPDDVESFCREGSRRYGWRAACVTFGADGCALFSGGVYDVAPACTVTVADPVGAGDAFSAALLHGLASNWPAAAITRFANRLGAVVAARRGAIPDWTLEDLHP